MGKKTQEKDQLKTWTTFCLRIRRDLLASISDCQENRMGISKTAWILEAIQEKIKRESKID